MCLDLLSDARLYAQLLQFDEDLFEQTREEGCPCGGVLHSARFPRKPRGALDAAEGYLWRHSLCCAEEGCRARRTPPSLRFLGRKVYLGAVVVVVTVMRHGITAGRAAALFAAVGASRETLARWRRWWREAFPVTELWRGARGRLQAPVAEEELPGALLRRFGEKDDVARLLAFLDFIKPVTTAAEGSWSGKSMVG